MRTLSAVVIVVLVLLAAFQVVGACPDPPPPPRPTREPVPTEPIPNDPPQDEPVPTPLTPPTCIAAPTPGSRTFSDGPTSAQKVILHGAGIVEMYEAGALRIEHGMETNQRRDIVLTPGQSAEYFVPVGVTEVYYWTEQGGHRLVEVLDVAQVGDDIELWLDD